MVGGKRVKGRKVAIPELGSLAEKVVAHSIASQRPISQPLAFFSFGSSRFRFVGTNKIRSFTKPSHFQRNLPKAIPTAKQIINDLITQFIVRRDLRAAFLLFGLLTTSGLYTILKMILRQPQPMMITITTPFIPPQSQISGMPSDHCSFVTVTSTLSLCFAAHKCSKMHYHLKSFRPWHSVVITPAFTLGITLLSRCCLREVLECCMEMTWYRLCDGTYQRCPSQLVTYFSSSPLSRPVPSSLCRCWIIVVVFDEISLYCDDN